MRIIEYNRQKVLEYAKTWALKRNPNYYNFSNNGGDCTNFASQCVFAGCGIMNYTPIMGWYYINSEKRTAAWTGVDFFYNFMTKNKGIGPFAKDVAIDHVQIGDIVQLEDSLQNYYHSLVVTKIDSEGIYVSAHDFDAYNRPLRSYSYYALRCLHIVGAREV